MVAAGYKQTEVGLIPEDWEIDEIIHHASISTGSRNTQDRKIGGKYPFFVRSQTIEKIDTYSFDGEAVLTAGDGVGTGKVFHYYNGKFDFHQRVYKISDFKPDINGYYFYIYFSNYFYDHIMSLTAKSSVDSIRKEMISKMLIVLPKIEEQYVIAKALSDVDALIVSLEKMIAKKQAIKTAAMQQLLTGKKRLPGYDKEWTKKPIDECFTFLPSGNNSRYDLSDEGDIGYIHYGDIHTKWNIKLDCNNEIIPLIAEEKVKKLPLLQDGDLILVDASEDTEGIGLCVEIKNVGERKIVAGLHTLLLRADSNLLVQGYRAYVLSTSSVRKKLQMLATGISVYGISKTNIKEIEIVFPPTIEEQSAIVEILDDIQVEIDQLKVRLEKIQAIKQGMMQELLTGRTRLI